MKTINDRRHVILPDEASAIAVKRALYKSKELVAAGLELSYNDVRVILYSQFLTSLGPVKNVQETCNMLVHQLTLLDSMVKEIISDCAERKGVVANKAERQMELSMT